jgi:Family of unknown function (DUF6159)
VERGFGDGARLMRASFELVRQDPALLWFPVVSTFCLVVSAGFWIFEGAWLYSVDGSEVSFVPLVALGLYTLSFVAIFFNVAFAGAAAQVLDGEEASLGSGLDVAWSRLGGIAVWAAYSVFVMLVLGFVESVKGMRWVGKAAEVAWSFATLFVVPLIALEGLGAGRARGRSFELARENWRAESGGLGALRAVLIVPGLLFFLAGKLLFSGHVHSETAKGLLGFVLLCGFALGTAVSVVRQVFAVELYRSSAGEPIGV